MTLNITIVTTSGEIHDEWTLAENVPQPDYRTRMSRHWDEWISRKPSSYLFHHPSSILSYLSMSISHHPASRKSRSTLYFTCSIFQACLFREELETLSNSGINYIRIPVGYWTWQVDPGEPFPDPILDDTDTLGALFYLKRLLVWLDQLGMRANIDLHGAPGSQNG